MSDLALRKSRKAEKSGGDFKRRDFLKAEHLPRDGKPVTVQVIGMREAGPKLQFSDYVLDVKIGSKEFAIGLKNESWQLDWLIEELGERSSKWPGKKFLMHRGVWEKSKGNKIPVLRYGAPRK